MTREDLRLKLQVLLSEFKNEHKLDEEEIHTIVSTFLVLVYSDKSTRLIWYREMQKVASMISQVLKNQGDMMAAALGLSEEEVKKLKERIKSKNKKVEN
jgi:hypothetical protein